MESFRAARGCGTQGARRGWERRVLNPGKRRVSEGFTVVHSS